MTSAPTVLQVRILSAHGFRMRKEPENWCWRGCLCHQGSVFCKGFERQLTALRKKKKKKTSYVPRNLPARLFVLISAFCFILPWLPVSSHRAGAGMSAHSCLAAWLSGGADTELKPIRTLLWETRCMDVIMLISGVMPLPLFPSLPAAVLLL